MTSSPPGRAQSAAPAWASPPDLLVLHAVRVAGLADETGLAHRTGVARDVVGELLGDDEARGRVEHVAFAGTRGWTLTARGRARDDERLAEELDASGARRTVERAHAAFEPLNARVVRACTRWQLRPRGGDALAANDHADPGWDGAILEELTAVEGDLGHLCEGLAGALARFEGHHGRFRDALARARAGEDAWVVGVGRASCHAVWCELHEDLLSTLGLPRGADPDRQE